MFYCDDEEIQAISKVLKERKLFRYQGPDVPTETTLFEKEFSDFLKCQSAVMVSSGTNAIVNAIKCLDIKIGDEILVPAYTFFATISAVIDAGAIPVIVDIDKTLCIDLNKAKLKLNSKTRALISVHMDGVPCNMDLQKKFATDHSLFLIEDCAQGLGAHFNGVKLGSIGDAGCFSFNVDKIISCGEGGAIAVKNHHHYQRAMMYHDTCNQFGPSFSGIYNIEPMIGRSMRVSEIQSAMIRVQLRRLDKIIMDLKLRKAYLDQKLLSSGLNLITPACLEGESGTTSRILTDDSHVAQELMIRLQGSGMRSIIAIMRPGHNPWKWISILPVSYSLSKLSFIDTVEIISRTVLVFISLEGSFDEWREKVDAIF